MALLYRSNAQSRILEHALFAPASPTSVRGLRFFERQEVKHALAYCAWPPTWTTTRPSRGW